MPATQVGQFGIERCKDGSFYVSGSCQIKKIIPSSDGSFLVQTVAGSPKSGYKDGEAKTALFRWLGGIVLDNKDNLYICDSGSNRIRILDCNGTVTTFKPWVKGKFGMKQKIKVQNPRAVAIDSTSEHLFFVDHRGCIFKIYIKTGMCIATILTDADGASLISRGLAVDAMGCVYYTTDKKVFRVDNNLANPTLIGNFIHSRSLRIDQHYLYVGTNKHIFKYDLKSRQTTHVMCTASSVTGMGLDDTGHLLYSDYEHRRIMKVKVKSVVPWVYVKLMWLGHSKNAPEDCPIATLPKELVRVILELCVQGIAVKPTNHCQSQ